MNVGIELKRSMKRSVKQPVIDNYSALEDVVRDSYASVVWSHKIQEKQADIYANTFRIMETVNITAASLTSAGIITIVFVDPLWLKLISAIISFATVFITAYLKSFNLQKLIASHKNSANRLISVRDQFKVLLTKINLQSDSVENLFLEYNELVKKKNDIYLEAPITTDKAVKMASKALKITKDNTFSEKEIDLFLPNSLRREK